MFENTQRDALARETKTSKSTVGTLSESKYWRGKRRPGLQVGTGVHFPPVDLFQAVFRISLTPGMDNKRFVVCFRDGGKTYLPSRGTREHAVVSHTYIYNLAYLLVAATLNILWKF
ncbi:hypothetical protein CDAR_48751 [Caerostris darwini]|uniref:Uncharacterized protein n=1 Tax=Caerostris darwini TaxID=1538125 RepID=A0AAV4NIF1_9ARAC|nr:hypothetical protein CDAR_48751 [Caerostris darwini]